MFLKVLLKISLLIVICLPITGKTENNNLKARYNDKNFSITYSPLTFSDGTNLTFITPEQYSSLSNKLSNVVIATHKRFSTIFGSIPQLSITIRLMEEYDFFKETKAPSWTNALFYKNEIIIPIPKNFKAFNFNDLARAIKHEYTHAIVSALSNNRCPGWLDEGLAQWAESYENNALKKALIRQVKKRNLISLSKLQGGFTKLDPELVPAAYAQSLYLTRSLINKHGLVSLKNFFKYLRLGYKKETAFIAAFNMNERYLEFLFKKKLMQKFFKHH